MTGRVSVVIRCSDQVGRLQSTVNSVLRSQDAPARIVVVVDDATPAPAIPWIESLAGWRDVSVVRASGSQPAAARNAGVRAAEEPLTVCLDAGDRLDPRYLHLAAARLEADAGIGWVTSWVLAVRPEETAVRGVGDIGPVGLSGDTDAVHGASMFRRRLWVELEGFDEELPVLEDYDFWLKGLGRGVRGALLELPLVVRLERDGSLHGRARTHPARPDTVRLIAERHRELFEEHVVAAVYGFEREMWHLSALHRDRAARRDALVSELADLEARANAWRERLPSDIRDTVDMGDLRRTSPVSTNWGYERGTPVDRHYIEAFLARHTGDIQGTVLEVQESNYTERFGGDRVSRKEVVDLNPANPHATLITDLRNARNAPSNRYDCIIVTQVLHVVDDMKAAIAECRRMLKPGGVLLVTLPCASRVCLEYGWDGDFWRVTEAGARALFSEVFSPHQLGIQVYGNVMVNAAFSYGLATHEVDGTAFEAYDPYNPTLVGVRAVKDADPPTPRVTRDAPETAGVGLVETPSGSRAGAVLLYHCVAEPAWDVHGLAVSPPVFERQMRFLKEAFHVMPLDEFVQANAGGCLPDRAVAITFDDGYLDNLTTAVPILASLGLPATFFLTTQALHGRGEYWWDTLERVLLAAPQVPPTLDVRLNGEHVRLDTATPEQRLAAHARVHRALVEADLATRDACVQHALAWGGPSVPPPRAHIMNAAQVHGLARQPGCAIGSHTVHHLGLPAQPLMVAEREISDSRRELEQLLQRPVTSFAYPYGYYSAETAGAARRAGVTTAFTCEARGMRHNDERLRLPRIEAKGWGFDELDYPGVANGQAGRNASSTSRLARGSGKQR